MVDLILIIPDLSRDREHVHISIEQEVKITEAMSDSPVDGVLLATRYDIP